MERFVHLPKPAYADPSRRRFPFLARCCRDGISLRSRPLLWVNLRRRLHGQMVSE